MVPSTASCLNRRANCHVLPLPLPLEPAITNTGLSDGQGGAVRTSCRLSYLNRARWRSRAAAMVAGSAARWRIRSGLSPACLKRLSIALRSSVCSPSLSFSKSRPTRCWRALRSSPRFGTYRRSWASTSAARRKAEERYSVSKLVSRWKTRAHSSPLACGAFLVEDFFICLEGCAGRVTSARWRRYLGIRHRCVGGKHSGLSIGQAGVSFRGFDVG